MDIRTLNGAILIAALGAGFAAPQLPQAQGWTEPSIGAARRSPNGGRKSGVAAAKRAARKRRNIAKRKAS